MTEETATEETVQSASEETAQSASEEAVREEAREADAPGDGSDAEGSCEGGCSEDGCSEDGTDCADADSCVDADGGEKLSFRDKKKLNAELKKLRAQIDAQETAAAEMKDRYTRLAAEFDNYKRRTAKELDSRYEDARGDVWKAILPVVDNFERALNHAGGSETDGDSFREAIALIYRQLQEEMKNAGVTEIEALHAPFNPELHNAMMHVEDETVGENLVVEVFVKGYKLADKVLRHSMVKVAN